MKDGLSQSTIYSIKEDSQGFIWLGTHDGLNRFDGHDFKQYKSDANKEGSLANNLVRKIFIDSKDRLWVGTQNGLSLYNKELDNFINFYHDENSREGLIDNTIWAIFEDNHGKVWVSTSEGVHKFNEDENQFSRIRIRGFEHNLKDVTTLYQDNKNNYWFGTHGNGIFISTEDLSYTFSLENKNNKYQLSLNASSLFDILWFNEQYYLATDQGVFTLDEDLSSLKSVDEINNLSSTREIRSLEIFDNSHLWVSSFDGLYILDINLGVAHQHRHSNTRYSLIDDEIRVLTLSSNQTMFIGTFKGLSVFTPQSALFEQITIKEIKNGFENIVADKKGNIWFTSKDSNIYSLSKDQELKALSSATGNQVAYLKLKKEELISLDFEQNLVFTDLNTSQSTLMGKVDIDPYDAHFKLTSDYESNLWFINTSEQLVKLNKQNETQIVFPQYEQVKAVKGVASEIWLMTQDSLFKHSVEDEDYSEIELSNQVKELIKIAKYFVSDKDNLWLITQSNGLVLYNLNSKRLIHFTVEQGLINETINSISIDDKQNAWITTNKGVSSINPQSGRIINYYSDYKLDINEPIESSAFLTKDQILYYGGIKNLTKVDTELALKSSNIISPPTLTNLLVLNKKITASNNTSSILKQQISTTEVFTLKYKDSPFSIEFVSPNASLPEQIGYRYILKGLDADWIETDASNLRATYTNLSAGLYEFSVQVFDKYRPEIAKTTSVKINILPPWWLSAKAVFVYILMLLAVFAYFIQQARYKRQYNLQIKKSEERLKLSLWGSGDEMWDWNISTGKIYRSNIWGILDFPQDGRRNLGTDQTNIHPQDIPRVREALNEHFEDDSTHFEATYRVKGKNDKWMWILDRGKIVERNKNNEATRMTGTLKDISHIKTAEERLKLFAKCIENISDAVIIYDRQFITVDVNKAYQKITGKTRQSMLGTSMKFTRYSEAFNQNVKKHLITKGSWHGEVESLRNNNDLYLTDLNIDVIRDENNNISHFVGVFSDITQRKKTEAELRKLANSDTLTGLPNRSYFQANQAKLVNNKTPHALLVFDLDNFKKINDSMGHEVGDVLLCKVAERILNVGRKQDSVYRLGGDEFSLIIEDTNDIHTITTIAKDILKTIAQPLKLKSQELVLYSSIGIVLFPEDGATPQELLKNADTAMYHAKDQGGNKYQFFSESMNKQAVKRLQIENLIRHGLKEDYFSVFYQPKIEISTGKISGMEALVRFETPTKGIISPGVFIPVSEETGQIIGIGEVVLRKSCIATKKWVDAGLFNGRIAVNLSAVQFTQPNLVKVISDILEETGLEAKYLELEITEGTVMDSPQEAIDTMLQIRAMGINLSLDDFGTGYSSLAYLKKFPLNTLKIDKAFVDDIEISDQGRNMVATIVTIAHNLGLNVVAEGVETEPQLSFLSGLRCEQMQGYLYSKPLSEKDFQNYLVSYRITDKSTKFTT